MKAAVALLPAIAAAAMPPAIPPTTPAELAVWATWVRDRHPTLGCPELGGAPRCAWPGRLDLEVGASGGRFRVDALADAPTSLPLPGGPGAWPEDVRLNGAPTPVLDVGGRPTVRLPPGEHALTGAFRWPALPQALPVPPEVGRVALRVDGAEASARREADGALRLGGGAGGEADHFEIDVMRRVADGVPLTVLTRISLRVSGEAREVDLGAVLLSGTEAVRIDGGLPARLEDDGRLKVQVRPGTWTIDLHAVHRGPAAGLTAPTPGGERWPDREIWSVALDHAARAVVVEGGAGVDPAATPLPPEWAGAPAWLVQPGEALRLNELRRGQPEPAPNQVQVQRTLWLDHDGGGFTFQDRLTGELHQGWRVDAQAPAELGHAANSGEDLVITAAPQAGVELRATALDLQAEGRLPGDRSLPAVGWDLVANRLQVDLAIPPGWALLHAIGPDAVSGALLQRLTLVDAFFAGGLAAMVRRLAGWRWAALAFAALGLSRMMDGSPSGTWVTLLLALMAVPLLRERLPALARPAQAVVLLCLLLLGESLLLQAGRAAVADRQAVHTDGQLEVPDRFVDVQAAEAPMGALSRKADLASNLVGRGSSGVEQKAKWASYDPKYVVQTGPGVPRGSGPRAQLTWSGRVGPDQRLTLLLLPPMALTALTWLQAGLGVALALRLTGAGAWLAARARHGGALITGLLLMAASGAPPPAAAAPDAALLQELEQRLLAPPACAPACVSAPVARLTLRGEAEPRLQIELEAHAGAPTTLTLPGPPDVWTPAAVEVDGRPAPGLARGPEGLLHLRVDPGVHRVRLEGPLTHPSSLVLQLGAAFGRVEVDAPGWTVRGQRADGTFDGVVQLARGADDPGGGRGRDGLQPMIQVERHIELGVPWRVVTMVRREGGGEAPVALSVPLLPGEAPTSPAVVLEGGAARLTLDALRPELSWESTLRESERLTLQAPAGAPWTEAWHLHCSPLFACAQAAGPAPLLAEQDGAQRLVWRVWPGEAVEVAVDRPAALAGQTLTVDAAELEVTVGQRESAGTLSVELRTSQGAQHPLRLGVGAAVQEVRIDDQVVPLRIEDGVLPVPLSPGLHRVSVRWTWPEAVGALVQAPELSLGAGAANLRARLRLPSDRWVLGATGGPRGPLVTGPLWSLSLGLAGALLAWLCRGATPLSPAAHALLGLGLGAATPELGLPALLFPALVGARARRAPDGWITHNLVQLAMLAAWGWLVLALAEALWVGLIGAPPARITGPGGAALVWALDRSDGGLPGGAVLSLPGWAWRLTMGAWTLWLLLQLPGWTRAAFAALAVGGAVRGPPRAPPPPPAEGEGPALSPDPPAAGTTA
jgi:hypothetical protein